MTSRSCTIEGGTDHQCKRELLGNGLRAALNSNGVALAKSVILETFVKERQLSYCVSKYEVHELATSGLDTLETRY